MNLVSVLSIIITIVIFGLIVVMHEFGHYIIAKKNGILVEEFAIGMGPLIYGRQKGDTLYSIRALPIGGYCKMLGEGEDVDDERSFSSKTVLQRMAVCVAGVVMNIILAYILTIILISVVGYNTSTINSVSEGSPAQQAGLQAGDRIVKYQGKSIHNFDYLRFVVAQNGGEMVRIVYERDGSRFETTLTPERGIEGSSDYKIGITSQYKAGFFSSAMEGVPRSGVLEILGASIWKTTFYVEVVLDGVKQLVTFNVSMDDLAGPVGIGTLVNDSIVEAQDNNVGIGGITIQMIYLAALLSANLAVFNLLPIPALDGGRLVFLLIEGIRRKPMDPEKEGMVHFIGMMALLLLAVFVTFKDILRLF